MKLLVVAIAFVCLTQLVASQSNNIGLLVAGGLLGFAASRSGIFGGRRGGFFPPPAYPGIGGFGGPFSPYGQGGFGYHRQPYFG